MAGQLIAPANRRVGLSPGDLAAEPVSFPSESGTMLSGWYVAGESKSKNHFLLYAEGQTSEAAGTILLLHSNRSNRRQMLNRARFLAHHGYSALLIDLQVHGESPGDQITAGHVERHDVRAAVAWIRERNPSEPVAIVGASLGGAATLLAGPLGVDAIVLESVYSTIDEAINNRLAMRIGPFRHLVGPLLKQQLEWQLGIDRSQLRPLDHVGEVGCPVLIMAGDEDQHTTIEEMERMFDAAREPKQLHIFQGAGHVDLESFDSEEYRRVVIAFLTDHLSRDALCSQRFKKCVCLSNNLTWSFLVSFPRMPRGVSGVARFGWSGRCRVLDRSVGLLVCHPVNRVAVDRGLSLSLGGGGDFVCRGAGPVLDAACPVVDVGGSHCHAVRRSGACRLDRVLPRHVGRQAIRRDW